MDGNTIIASALLLTSLNWNLAAAADLSNDGKADLLWYNSSTGEIAAWLMSQTSPTSAAILSTDPDWRLKCIKGTSVMAEIACDDSLDSVATGTTPANQAPIVNSGADQSITPPDVANTVGNAIDDAIITLTAAPPCGNTVITGTRTLLAIATDNVGVVGVQFKLDGANLGAELTTAPYSIPWDTTMSSDGCHMLSAVARNAAENQTWASLSVTVGNSPTQ
jgi:hypothetical protein